MLSKNEILKLIAQLDTQGDIKAERVIQKIVLAGSACVPYLIAAAQNDEFPRIMKWSLLALGTIGDKRGSSILTKALGHERMTVKLQAMSGLARMNHKTSAKKIALLLNDESGGVRGRALSTLIKLNNKSIVLSLLPMLNDPMWYIRKEACRACEHFKVQAAIPVLLELKKGDAKKAVRAAATDALKAMKYVEL